MNNKIVWSVFSMTLVLVTIGAGCNKQAGQQANQAASPASQNESISGSIKDLLKLGKSIKCDLAKASTEILSGTSYISGNKARSDFEMRGGDGKIVTGHFIMEGTIMYSWSDANKAQAMKVNIAELEKLSGNPQAKTSGADNYSDNMDYKCTGWSPDASKFVPPADIKFQDFSALMNQFQNTLKQTKINVPANVDTKSLCATCDKMPNADTKAQCRQSLGCK